MFKNATISIMLFFALSASQGSFAEEKYIHLAEEKEKKPAITIDDLLSSIKPVAHLSIEADIAGFLEKLSFGEKADIDLNILRDALKNGNVVCIPAEDIVKAEVDYMAPQFAIRVRGDLMKIVVEHDKDLVLVIFDLNGKWKSNLHMPIFELDSDESFDVSEKELAGREFTKCA